MDANEFKTLCLKQAYGAPITEAEQGSLDAYVQTADGREYLRECGEMKDLLKDVVDVKIKPADHEAMVKSFESTVRQKFDETVFRPWWEANSPPIILGLMAGFFLILHGASIINIVLLGSCVLWLIADGFQRTYFANILSKPDLYDYAKASRRRSDRILKSVPGMALVIVLSGLAVVAVSYVAYRGYQEFGVIVPAIVVLVLIETIVIFVYQHRKLKRSDSNVWDWWAEEIKE